MKLDSQRGCIIGLKHQIEILNYFYGVNFDSWLLKHSDNVSHTIQYSHMPGPEYQLVVALPTKILANTSSDKVFSLSWEKCKKAAADLDTGEPVLLR